MKISRLQIENFRQFRHLDLDLTYPKGHAKEGQPLDKVCIIGKNGTGKSNLLFLISDFHLHRIGQWDSFTTTALDDNSVVTLTYGKGRQNGRTIRKNESEFTCFKMRWGISNLLFFQAGLNSDNLYDTTKNEDFVTAWRNVAGRYFYIQQEAMQVLDENHFVKCQEYITNLINYKLLLFNRLERGDVLNLGQELQVWKEKNPSPLEEIAKHLDPIFAPFDLKIKTIFSDSELPTTLELESTLNQKTVAYVSANNGARQLLNTFYPLYHLQTPNTLMLLDEPETSLDPEIQRNLIHNYAHLRSNSELQDTLQIVCATHSPFIQGAFEPWEVVELVKGADGFVTRQLHYTGENHIDNYKK